MEVNPSNHQTRGISGFVEHGGIGIFPCFLSVCEKMMIHRWNLGDPAPSLGWENGEGGSTDQHPTIRPTNEAWDHLGWGNSGANRTPTHPKDCLENPLNMSGNAMEHMLKNTNDGCSNAMFK